MAIKLLHNVNFIVFAKSFVERRKKIQSKQGHFWELRFMVDRGKCINISVCHMLYIAGKMVRNKKAKVERPRTRVSVYRTTAIISKENNKPNNCTFWTEYLITFFPPFQLSPSLNECEVPHKRQSITYYYSVFNNDDDSREEKKL